MDESFFAKFCGQPPKPPAKIEVTSGTVRSWLCASIEATPIQQPGVLLAELRVPQDFKLHIDKIFKILTTEMGCTQAVDYSNRKSMAFRSFIFEKDTISFGSCDPYCDTKICGGQESPDYVIIKLYVQ